MACIFGYALYFFGVNLWKITGTIDSDSVTRRELDEYFPPTQTKYFVRRQLDSSGFILEIYTDLDFETALKQTEKFEDDWWLDNMPTDDYSLFIDVMFA